MKIVSKRALGGACIILAYACANPVDISGDVLVTDPSLFGDAGVFAGAGGGASAGTGGDVGGGAGGTAQSGTGGTSSSPAGAGGTGIGSAGTGNGTGGTSQVGLGGSGPIAGNGGSASGGAATAGSGGAATAGSGGTSAGGAGGTAIAGAGGTTAGTGGSNATAGTGGTGTGGQPVFDANACDFEDVAGCEDLACEQVCPTNDGGSCVTRCTAVIDCVTTNSTCITEDDPLCGARDNGATRACTTVVEPAGGANPQQTTQPSFVARQFVECVCSTPRP